MIHKEEHQAIVPLDLWNRVHAMLQVRLRTKAKQNRSQTLALLRGLIFGIEGRALSPVHTLRRGRQYRYGGDEDAATVHSTQKPVECLRRSMINNSEAGQAIYEPFSGSGTTIIAAETTGRACLAMEISPAYCDVAILRWQLFTGKQAVRDRDDRVFNEIAAARVTPPAA